MTIAEATAVAPGRFAQIMRRLAGPVSVVTTLDQHGRPRGLTSSAVTSVSAEPPLLSVCVDLGSRTLPAVRYSSRFVVHFLDDTAAATAAVFASKAADKFSAISWDAAPSGLPRLRDGVAGWAECSLSREVLAGDHVILLGQVVDGHTERPAKMLTAPLLYHDRKFGRLATLD
jgi:flavin reductase (DIM6/NTAB) family NADH-FMN oxidoreductase RutF